MTGSGHPLSSAAAPAQTRPHWPAPARCGVPSAAGHVVGSVGLSLARGSTSSACFAPRLDHLGSRNIISASLGPVEAEPTPLHTASASASCFLSLSLAHVCVCLKSWEAFGLDQSPHVPRHPQTSESRGARRPWTRRQRADFVWSQLWIPTTLRCALTGLPPRPGRHLASEACTCSPSGVDPKALTKKR